MSRGKRRNFLMPMAGCCLVAAAARGATDITASMTANDSVALSGGSYSVTTTSGSPITYSAVLSGTGTVAAIGNGTLILENTNTYTLPTVTETISELEINSDDKQFGSYEGYTTQFSPALANGDDGGFNGPIYTLKYGSSNQPDIPAMTIDAGVDLQLGSNTDLHEGDGEVGAGNISNPTTSNMNLDNILDNGTLTFQGNNASFSDTQYIGQISGTGPVIVQTGIMALYNANSFSGPLLIENNMTLILGSDHITASIPNASAVFNNGTLIVDTPYNTPAGTPMTITQNIYENHFGNDINVNGFGGVVILAGVNTYTDNSNNTNDPTGQLSPTLSNSNDNFTNELNVIDNRRGINLGISSGTGSTNPAGGILQLGNGTSTNFFLPGNPLTTYISMEQNSILSLDYSNSGPTYVNTIIAGGPTGTSDTQESLATPGTGAVIFHQGDIVVTQQQYYDGTTQIDSGATIQLGDGTKGDTTKTGSGEISFQTSGGDGDLLQSGQTVTVTDTTGEAGHSSTSTGTSACVLIDNGSLVVDNVNATLLSSFSGTGKLTQAGAGTTTLGSSISYTGATLIAGGTLALGSGGSLASSSGVTISSAGRSSLVAAPYSSANTNFATVGAPVLDISQAGNQTLQSLTGDATGSVYLGSNTLTVGSSASTVFAGKILNGGIAGGIGGSLTKQGTGSLTLSNVNSYTGPTTINGGTLIIAPTPTANTVALPDNPVVIGAAGELQLADNASASTPNNPTNQLLQISSLSITTGGKLDLRNNHFYVADPGSTPDDSTYTNILSWVKTGAITSTEGLPGYGVGVVDGNDGVLGASVSANQIEVAYTLEGDANLDGKVDINDFNIFAPNFGLPTTLGWEAGDFNYSGTVDIADFNLFSANFGLSDTGTAVSLPSADLAALDAFAAANGLSLTSVPEPASLVLLTLGAFGILSRRRRCLTNPAEQYR